MKIFVAVIVFGLLNFTGNAFSNEMMVRVPAGNGYPPFFEQDKNDTWGGLSIELVEVLLTEAGYKSVYVHLPFPRAIKYMKDGQINIMLNLSITEERKKFIYFIGPQLDETVVLIVKKDTDFNITSLEDFKKLPKPIGIERKKVYGQIFEKKRKEDKNFNAILHEVTEVSLNEIKLERNRLSGFLGYGYNSYYRIKTDPSYKDFKVHPFTINSDWVYFGFSKKSISTETLSVFSDAYERAKKDDLFEKVRQKYILKK